MWWTPRIHLALFVHRVDGVTPGLYLLPRDPAVLQMLPGVGRYTAGAIASIAFGVRAPVVDGNVKRVLARLYNIAESIDDVETERTLWALADALVPATKLWPQNSMPSPPMGCSRPMRFATAT